MVESAKGGMHRQAVREAAIQTMRTHVTGLPPNSHAGKRRRTRERERQPCRQTDRLERREEREDRRTKHSHRIPESREPHRCPIHCRRQKQPETETAASRRRNMSQGPQSLLRKICRVHPPRCRDSPIFGIRVRGEGVRANPLPAWLQPSHPRSMPLPSPVGNSPSSQALPSRIRPSSRPTSRPQGQGRQSHAAARKDDVG